MPVIWFTKSTIVISIMIIYAILVPYPKDEDSIPFLFVLVNCPAMTLFPIDFHYQLN